MKRRVKMNALRNKTITSVIAMSIAFLSLPAFQTAGDAERFGMQDKG